MDIRTDFKDKKCIRKRSTLFRMLNLFLAILIVIGGLPVINPISVNAADTVSITFNPVEGIKFYETNGEGDKKLYEVDNKGNFILDDSGNKIETTTNGKEFDLSGQPVTVPIGENYSFLAWVDSSIYNKEIEGLKISSSANNMDGEPNYSAEKSGYICKLKDVKNNTEITVSSSVGEPIVYIEFPKAETIDGMKFYKLDKDGNKVQAYGQDVDLRGQKAGIRSGGDYSFLAWIDSSIYKTDGVKISSSADNMAGTPKYSSDKDGYVCNLKNVVTDTKITVSNFNKKPIVKIKFPTIDGMKFYKSDENGNKLQVDGQDVELSGEDVEIYAENTYSFLAWIDSDTYETEGVEISSRWGDMDGIPHYSSEKGGYVCNLKSVVTDTEIIVSNFRKKSYNVTLPKKIAGINSLQYERQVSSGQWIPHGSVSGTSDITIFHGTQLRFVLSLRKSGYIQVDVVKDVKLLAYEAVYDEATESWKKKDNAAVMQYSFKGQPKDDGTGSSGDSTDNYITDGIEIDKNIIFEISGINKDKHEISFTSGGEGSEDKLANLQLTDVKFTSGGGEEQVYTTEEDIDGTDTPTLRLKKQEGTNKYKMEYTKDGINYTEIKPDYGTYLEFNLEPISGYTDSKPQIMATVDGKTFEVMKTTDGFWRLKVVGDTTLGVDRVEKNQYKISMPTVSGVTYKYSIGNEPFSELSKEYIIAKHGDNVKLRAYVDETNVGLDIKTLSIGPDIITSNGTVQNDNDGRYIEYVIEEIKNDITATVSVSKIQYDIGLKIDIADDEKVSGDSYSDVVKFYNIYGNNLNQDATKNEVGTTKAEHGSNFQFKIDIGYKYSQSAASSVEVYYVPVDANGNDMAAVKLAVSNGVYTVQGVTGNKFDGDIWKAGRIEVRNLKLNRYNLKFKNEKDKISFIKDDGTVIGDSSTVKYGDTYKFNVELGYGYSMDGSAVTANGVALRMLNGNYVLDNIIEDYSIEVLNINQVKYPVTFPSDIKGITFTDSSGSQINIANVEYKNSYNFGINFEDSYNKSEDKIRVYAVPSSKFDGNSNYDPESENSDKEKYVIKKNDNGKYTIPDVSQGMKIVVKGVEVNKYDVSLPTTEGVKFEVSYKIDDVTKDKIYVNELDADTVTETVSSGKFPVVYGNNFYFKPIAETGYDISKISIPLAEQLRDGYVVQGLMADVSLEITGVTISNYTVTLKGEGVKFYKNGASKEEIRTGSVEHQNGQFQFVISINEGYYAVNGKPVVTVQNTSGEGVSTAVMEEPSFSGDTYKLTGVTENSTVIVDGIEMEKHTVTLPIGQEGIEFYSVRGYLLSDRNYDIAKYYNPEVDSASLVAEDNNNGEIKYKNGNNLVYIKYYDKNDASKKPTLIKYYPIDKDASDSEYVSESDTPVLERKYIYSSDGKLQYSVDYNTNSSNEEVVWLKAYYDESGNVSTIEDYDIYGFVGAVRHYDTSGNLINIKVGYDSDFSFEVRAKYGYDLSGINVTAGENTVLLGSSTGTDARVYTVKNIKSSLTVEVNNTDKQKYNVKIKGDNLTFYDENGTTVLSGNQEIKYQTGSLGFKIAANTGYNIYNGVKFYVLEDGGAKRYEIIPNDTSSDNKVKISGPSSSGVYTVTNVTERTVVSVEGAIKNKYTITFPTDMYDKVTFINPYAGKDDKGAWIEAPLDTQNQTEYLSEFYFRIKPKEGYNINSVDVNVEPYGKASIKKTAEGYYTIYDTIDDISVTVSGVELNEYDVVLKSSGADFYTEGGTQISNFKVKHGKSDTFILQAKDGYNLLSGYTVKITGSNGDSASFRVGDKMGYDSNGNAISIEDLISTGSTSVDGKALIIKDSNGQVIFRYNYYTDTSKNLVDFDNSKISVDYDNGRVTKVNYALNTESNSYEKSISVNYTDDLSSIVSVTYDDNKIISAESSESNVSLLDGTTIEDIGRFKYRLSDVKGPITVSVEDVGRNEYNIYFPNIIAGIEFYNTDNNKITEGKVSHGGSFSFKIVATDGYSIDNIAVTANSVLLELKDGKYTIDRITSDTTINVEGVAPTQVAVKLKYSSGVTYTDVDGNELSTLNDIKVVHGGTFNFKISLNEAYNQSNEKMKVTADKSTLTFNRGIYTLSDITEDTTITVSDVDINKYSVTLTENSGSYYLDSFGQKELKGVQTAKHGENFSFMIGAQEGYDISNLIVTVKGERNERVELNPVDGVYTISGMSENYVVVVENAVKSTYKVEIRTTTGVAVLDTSGNAINNQVVVNHGESVSFKLSLGASYDDSRPIVSVKGKTQLIEPVNDIYTVSDIRNDTIVEVSGVTKNTYTVTLQKTEGVVYKNSRNKVIEGSVEVEWNDTFIFKVSLMDAYDASSPLVMVDDKLTLMQNGGVYELPNVTGDKTITVKNVKQNSEESVIGMVLNLPSEIKTMSDAQAVIAASKSFQALSESEQKLVTNLSELENAQDAAAEILHTSNGVTVGDIDWYIQVIVTPLDSDEQSVQRISEKVDRKSIISLYEITLWDTLRDEKYILPSDVSVTVVVPAPDLNGYKNEVIIHEKSSGNIEYLDVLINNGYAQFETSSFSAFGVAAKKIPNYVERPSDITISVSNIADDNTIKKVLADEDVISSISSGDSLNIGSDSIGGNMDIEDLSQENIFLRFYNWALEHELIVSIFMIALFSAWIVIIVIKNKKKEKNN